MINSTIKVVKSGNIYAISKILYLVVIKEREWWKMLYLKKIIMDTFLQHTTDDKIVYNILHIPIT